MTEVFKTYIFLNHKALCLVKQPMGKKDAQGNKIPRVAYQFSPNWEGKAEFKTSDPKVQAYIENTEKYKTGQIIIHSAQGNPEPEADEPEETSVPAESRGRGTRKNK